jgi:hypothetical protein
MQVKGACDAGISARGQRAAFNAVKKGVIKQGDEALFNKAGRLADGFDRDPFNVITGKEEFTVKRIINKRGETTWVWDHDIDNLAEYVDDILIIQEGRYNPNTPGGYGWKKIWNKHKIQDIDRVYGFKTESEIIDMIEKTIKEGENYDSAYYYPFETSPEHRLLNPDEHFLKFKVVIGNTPEKKGTIISAYPDEIPRKRNG